MEENLCFSGHPELGFLVPGKNFLMRIQCSFSNSCFWGYTRRDLNLTVWWRFPRSQYPLSLPKAKWLCSGKFRTNMSKFQVQWKLCSYVFNYFELAEELYLCSCLWEIKQVVLCIYIINKIKQSSGQILLPLSILSGKNFNCLPGSISLTHLSPVQSNSLDLSSDKYILFTCEHRLIHLKFIWVYCFLG